MLNLFGTSVPSPAVLAGCGVVMLAWLAVRMHRLRRSLASKEVELSEAESRVAVAVRDRVAADAKRRLTIALLPSETGCAAEQFLSALVPHASRGFAELCEDGDAGETIARGRVAERLVADDREDISRDGRGVWTVRLPGAMLRCSDFAGLSEHDDVADAVRSLGPAIVASIQSVREDRIRENELARTQAMLRLRAIAERPSTDASPLLDEYLSELLRLLPFERASLFMSNPPSQRRIATAGPMLSTGVRSAVEAGEDALIAGGTAGITTFDSAQLRATGETAFANAACVLVIARGDRVRASLSLTSSKSADLSDGDRAFLTFVSEHLFDLLGSLRDRLAVTRQATTDGLTGLTNRSELDRRMAVELERCCEAAPVSLVLFDLDRFKRVNDIHGHAAGDAALKHVADLLRDACSRLRADDTPLLARYGGEELLLMLPGAPAEAMVRIAEQVRASVANNPLTFNGREIPLTISGGVAAAPTDGTTATELLAVADEGLYAAKRGGRNRIVRDSKSVPA